MKRKLGFWESLEQYTWKMVERVPVRWEWVRISIILIVLATSLKYGKYSVSNASNIEDVIKIAARSGDYQTAGELLNHYTNKSLDHLTNESLDQLEDLVYPERKVEMRIAELEAKLEIYPENKEIYLMLSDLYGQLMDERAGEPRPYKEIADEYREKARVLDPN